MLINIKYNTIFMKGGGGGDDNGGGICLFIYLYQSYKQILRFDIVVKEKGYYSCLTLPYHFKTI